MHHVARPLRAAAVTLAALSLAAGILYPALVLGIGQVIAPAQANGSLVHRDGQVIGSALVGQAFVGPDGKPLRQYLQGRPSAAGDGYDASQSSGSNFGPENPELIAQIKERRTEIAQFEGVDPQAIPADALTASSSGLDPHISPAYAKLQASRIAKERGIDVGQVQRIIDEHTARRAAGLIGEETVNVLEVNVALDALQG